MLGGYYGMMGILYNLKEDCNEMNEEFDRRAEQARELYLEAANFPRKTKKRVRKEAMRDFFFYKGLVQFNDDLFSKINF